ncbi:hypothetical protein [Portibacter marinus]|uniref:hypothetical protein n=1 Tax=Portibacter marinus TaxID=2898660 RepID=UPI001F250BA4|nr:hypothetical protein [Portibacter marinus]
MIRNLVYPSLFLCMFSFLGMHAQQVDDSPFSAFGLGNIHSDNLVFYQGFAGQGASYTDPYHINIQNPASYAFLNRTAFEVGVSARYFEISDGENRADKWKGNLDYLALGFPLRNPINASLDPIKRDVKLGMALFLKPHTTVGYNISSTYEDDNLGLYQKDFEGNGGLYKLMWGNALQYKAVSFGANVGYLFGNINYNESIDFLDANTALENMYTIDYNVNGFIWDAGILYNWFINKKEFESDKSVKTKMLNLGLYGNSAHNFYTLNEVTRRTAAPEGLNVYQDWGADTLQYASGLRGEGRLPAEFGIGATYYHDSKYSIGFNFDYGAWSTYKNSVREETLSDSWKLSIGGTYRPDVKSFNNYFKRVIYKAGVFYQRDPQIIENVQVTDAGLNMGASFPFYYQRKISHINAAFRFGVRGTGTPLIERYARISVGFTFNDDEWFIKRKYN